MVAMRQRQPSKARASEIQRRVLAPCLTSVLCSLCATNTFHALLRPRCMSMAPIRMKGSIAASNSQPGETNDIMRKVEKCACYVGNAASENC